jgi:hypothetical protein
VLPARSFVLPDRQQSRRERSGQRDAIVERARQPRSSSSSSRRASVAFGWIGATRVAGMTVRKANTARFDGASMGS